MASKIPLQQMLQAVDRGDKEFYSNLTDEQKKDFSPWLAMRFASSCKDNAEHYLLMVNDFVNADFGTMYNHPELQWKLIALCGIGYKQFHPWIKPGKKKGKNKIQAEISKLHPNMRYDELDLFESLNTKADLKNMFKDAGYPDKEIKDIFK